MDTVVLPDWLYVPLIAGSLTPILTGVLTKLDAHPGTKALVAAILTGLVAVIDSIARHGSAFQPAEMLVLWVTTFAWHCAAYFGILKPAGGGVAPGAAATATIGVG